MLCFKMARKVQCLHSQVKSASDELFGETVQDPTYIPEESDNNETGEEESDEYESGQSNQPSNLQSS